MLRQRYTVDRGVAMLLVGNHLEIDRSGNGVSRTNCAKVRSACSASATVASNVSRVSLLSPKMKEPQTWNAVTAEALEGAPPVRHRRD